MATAAALLVFLFVLPATYAVDFTVGDTDGWGQTANYATWASGKTFTVGDRLLFTYGSSHSLDVVNKAAYDNCASSNALESHTDGNTFITLKQAGPMYFLCPAFGHCAGGMKLAVTVSAASPTPGGATPTPSTPSPTTPAPTTPSPGTTTGTPTTKPNGATSNLMSISLSVLAAFICIYAFMG